METVIDLLQKVTIALLLIALLIASLLVISILEIDLFDWELGRIVLSERVLSGIITIIASIVAIAFPISLTMVTSTKGSEFDDNEFAESFYKEKAYVSMRRIIYILIPIAIIPLFDQTHSTIKILAVMILIYVLRIFKNFIKTVETYSSDFPTHYLEKVKDQLNGIIK